MSINDPISDLLTRIRNAKTAKHRYVDVPKSKALVSVLNILVEKGFVEKRTYTFWLASFSQHFY